MASSSSTDRPDKLARINDLRRKLPHMSASAMAALMADMKKGVPDLTCRKHVTEAKVAEISRHTAYGPLLQDVALQSTESSMSVQMVNLQSLLYGAYSEEGGLHSLMMARHSAHPSSREGPWGLALYCDEVVPGNPLSHDNTRKVWVFYGSFVEFGFTELSREQLWLTLCVIRTSVIPSIQGGVSQILAAMVKHIFKDNPCNPTNVGVVLKGPDGASIRLFFDFSVFIADGAAHRSIWNCKGDSGSKFCIFCRNLFAEKIGIVEDGETLLVCSQIDRSTFDLAMDSDIFGTVDRLVQKKQELSAAHFKKWEQAAGFTLNPGGILFDPNLRDVVKPISQHMADWCHGMFVKGVFQTTAFLLILALSSCKVDVYTAMTIFLASWQLPVGKLANASALTALFTAKRKKSNKEAGAFKCFASEGLSLYSLLGLYIQECILPSGKATAACVAYLSLCNLLDLLSAVVLGGIDPNDVDVAAYQFLLRCREAGWAHKLHGKFHWILHFGDHMRKHGGLLSCWVHERRHKLVKRYSQDVYRLADFEKIVLSEMACHDLMILRNLVYRSGCALLNPKAATKKVIDLVQSALAVSFDSCLTSLTVTLESSATCSKGDICLFTNQQAGEIWLHCDVDGCLWSLVQFFVKVDYNAESFKATWQRQGQLCFVHTSAIQCAMIHSKSEDHVYTLLPLVYRF